ncbi:hypothetical protein PC119_g6234 [Phytophthora cactorum]|nr:hypothetical protein PC114_g13506 [Phytophthora cactorum]KAG3030586.1 hypothetical protein PC119_g6234 [Phytophthora cactorum]KAG4053994.1 hypothetical protein PC123_g10872 [Phytophthora cactorum]
MVAERTQTVDLPTSVVLVQLVAVSVNAGDGCADEGITGGAVRDREKAATMYHEYDAVRNDPSHWSATAR